VFVVENWKRYNEILEYNNEEEQNDEANKCCDKCLIFWEIKQNILFTVSFANIVMTNKSLSDQFDLFITSFYIFQNYEILNINCKKIIKFLFLLI